MNFNFKNDFFENKGQAALIAVFLILTLIISAIFTMSSSAFKEARVAQENTKSRFSFYAAESGIEDAVYRLKAGKILSPSFVISLNGAFATTTVTTVTPTKKEISSRGDFSQRVRGLKAVMSTETSASFHYGTQTGNGGFQMENNSQVNGSVYSNGNIVGNNYPRITGDAFAAGTSRINSLDINGNARAGSIVSTNNRTAIWGNASSTTIIDGAEVGGSAWADTFNRATIGGNAYYVTSVSSDTRVGGQKIQIPSAPGNLPLISMPISDSQLDAWEQDALAGGVISSPCPYRPQDGSFLGPVKIACDLEIDGTKIVTMRGTIWVAGNFEIENSAKLKLDPSFGSLSGIVIVDNPANRITSSKLEVQNSAEILGSGTAGSYVMAVSRNNSAEQGGSEEAIEVGNSSSATIYYAPRGKVLIQNNVSLKEVSAYNIHLKNSAVVTYESGLANVNFSSGPTGGWNIKTWEEIVP